MLVLKIIEKLTFIVIVIIKNLIFSKRPCPAIDIVESVIIIQTEQYDNDF